MKTLLITLLLAACAAPAFAHDPAEYSRHQQPATPVVTDECAQFEGKDPKTLDFSDASKKATYDACEANKNGDPADERN